MADNSVVANPGVGGASFPVDVDGAGKSWPYTKLAVGASGTQTEVSSTSGLPTVGQQITPAAATASQIATGGTAVTVITGPINGGFITNPINSAAQGIADAENLYIDMVGTPGSTDAAANGTTSLLMPGQGFELPALAAGVTVKANAATDGHKFTVNVW